MGLDSHDTGIVIVAELLRNAGYEVIYLGLHNDAKAVVHAAVQEDADAIGVSFLSGQHMTQMRLLLEAVRRAGVEIPVFCGGVIPRDDASQLRAQGVAEVFAPGTLGPAIVERIDRIIRTPETA
jgi:methylmalonyl-CoA mutase C-terminal domain/subunit